MSSGCTFSSIYVTYSDIYVQSACKAVRACGLFDGGRGQYLAQYLLVSSIIGGVISKFPLPYLICWT